MSKEFYIPKSENQQFQQIIEEAGIIFPVNNEDAANKELDFLLMKVYELGMDHGKQDSGI